MDTVPANCVPMRVKFESGGPTVSWCFDDGHDFDDPFFDESVRRCLHRPFNRAFMPQTPIAALKEFADTHDGRPPDAFIFHMSRCGSTLLAQMFTALPDTRVISEASTLDRVLYAYRMVTPLAAETQIDWLRALTRCYGVRPGAAFARHLVKLDAWHIDQVTLIEQAFPGVPWVYLYRNPLEVLVSNLALRAASTLPGVTTHQLPGVDLMSALSMPAESFLGQILRHNMQSALQHRSSPHGMYVNYTDLPDVALPVILEHFGMSVEPPEIQRMLTKATHNAKQPAIAFVPDTSRKQNDASPIARHLADTLLMPLYEELESIRWRQTP